MEFMKLSDFSYTTEFPVMNRCLTYNFVTGDLYCHTKDSSPVFDMDTETGNVMEYYCANCINSDVLRLAIAPAIDRGIADKIKGRAAGRVEKMRSLVQDRLVSFIEALIDKKHCTKLYITWLGSDPLSYIDVIENITAGLDAFAEKIQVDIASEVITQGYLLDQPMADRLSGCHIYSVIIDADDFKWECDNDGIFKSDDRRFTQIENKLLSLKTDIAIYIRTNYHRKDISHIHALKKWTYMMVDRTGNFVTPYYSSVLESEMGKKLSMADIHYYYAIDEMGNLYKSPDFFGRDECITGNILDDKYTDKCEAPFSERHYHLDEDCKGCRLLGLCQNGCPDIGVTYGNSCCTPVKNDVDSYVLGRFRLSVEMKFGELDLKRIERVIEENGLNYWLIMYFLRFRYDEKNNGKLMPVETGYLKELGRDFNSYMLNNEYLKKMLQLKDMGYVDQSLDIKADLFRRIPECMGRDYLDMSAASDEDIYSFVKRHRKFVSKQNCLAARNFAVYTDCDFSVVEELRSKKADILEEYIEQHEEYKKIFPKSVSVVRIHTITNTKETKTVLNPVIKIGTGDTITDGMGDKDHYSVMTDDKGRILEALHVNRFAGIQRTKIHEETGYEFTIGKCMPYIKEACNLCIKAAKSYPKNGFTGWDVAITPTGPVIVEGNKISGFMDYYQMINYIYRGYGCRTEIEEIIDFVQK